MRTKAAFGSISCRLRKRQTIPPLTASQFRVSLIPNGREGLLPEIVFRFASTRPATDVHGARSGNHEIRPHLPAACIHELSNDINLRGADGIGLSSCWHFCVKDQSRVVGYFYLDSGINNNRELWLYWLRLQLFSYTCSLFYYLCLITKSFICCVGFA